jgi:hypothetical protein
MGRLSRQGAKKLLVITIISIVSYAMGALAHSEIMHFFAEVLGIR